MTRALCKTCDSEVGIAHWSKPKFRLCPKCRDWRAFRWVEPSTASLPGTGVLVWRVDPTSGARHMALVEARQSEGLERVDLP